MFLKSSKQAYGRLVQSRQTLSRASMAAVQAGPLMQFSMCARTTARRAVPVQVMGSAPSRAFSLPDHIVLEMPNLSPTMEKVRHTVFDH